AGVGLMSPEWKDGLEDVVAARSGICAIDGGAGELRYRGYEIGELAGARSFEAVTYLLWMGELPDPATEAAFAASLSAPRGVPREGLALLRTPPPAAPPLHPLPPTPSPPPPPHPPP